MAHICQVHPYEAAEGLCRSCGGPFCADCLVYPFGPLKPPFCVPCAVTAGGVRSNARNPTVVVPKETKRRLKEWRKARKRDLDSPPPDGVATWQKMDEARRRGRGRRGRRRGEGRGRARGPAPAAARARDPDAAPRREPGPARAAGQRLAGRDRRARRRRRPPPGVRLRPRWSAAPVARPSPARARLGADGPVATRRTGRLAIHRRRPGPHPPEPDYPTPPPSRGRRPRVVLRRPAADRRPADAPRTVEIDPEPLFGHGRLRAHPVRARPAGTPLGRVRRRRPSPPVGLGGAWSAGPLPPPPPAGGGRGLRPLPPPPDVAPLGGRPGYRHPTRRAGHARATATAGPTEAPARADDAVTSRRRWPDRHPAADPDPHPGRQARGPPRSTTPRPCWRASPPSAATRATDPPAVGAGSASSGDLHPVVGQLLRPGRRR